MTSLVIFDFNIVIGWFLLVNWILYSWSLEESKANISQYYVIFNTIGYLKIK